MINRFQDNAANERTFLSWIRTAITIAGFGIIIEKLQGSTDAKVGMRWSCLDGARLAR